jgi:hypothetical protein
MKKRLFSPANGTISLGRHLLFFTTTFFIWEMEPHASSKLPTFHQCQEVYEKFKVSIKNGENPLDESWELLVNAAVKKDHLRAWRKHEVLKPDLLTKRRA